MQNLVNNGINYQPSPQLVEVKAGFLDPVSPSEESLDTSLPQTSASGTDSAGSVRYARPGGTWPLKRAPWLFAVYV